MDSRLEMRGRMIGTLRGRGALEAEAEELVDQLFADCLCEEESLLGKFHGRCDLEVWLLRVAINRLVSVQRRESSRRRRVDRRLEAGGEAAVESDLRDLARESLKAALAALPHQWRVLLWLRHGFGVSQERLSVAWRCSPSKISRILSRARLAVRRGTLSAVAKVEPGLVLGWEEICAACHDDELFGR